MKCLDLKSLTVLQSVLQCCNSALHVHGHALLELFFKIILKIFKNDKKQLLGMFHYKYYCIKVNL